MKGRDLLAIFCGAVLFALVALLWYVRPSSELWLLGSLAWAAIAYAAFMYYVTRPN